MSQHEPGRRGRWAARTLVCAGIALAFMPVLGAGSPRQRQPCACGHHFSTLRRHAFDRQPMFHAPIDGTWYWMRSPDEEKSAAAGLFNRYCIRCHGVDGRGVWDIPGIPNFTNVRWQASRSDDQLARAIMEGRGAVMPTFRGALALEEAWALARHVRTFIPGSEVSRPDDGEPEKGKEATKKPGAAGSEPTAKDAPSPKGKKSTKKPDAAAPEPAGVDTPTPKGKKPTKKPDTAAPEPAGEEVPSPKGEEATKKPDAGAPEPPSDEAPAPKGKKAKKKPDAAASDEAPAPKADNVPTLKPPR